MTDQSTGGAFRRPFLPVIRASRPARRQLARLRFLHKMRRQFRNTPPKTLNEKIHFKMAFDRNPLLVTLADKSAVRGFVSERLGTDVLTHLYDVVATSDDIQLNLLPDRCVIKPTHGSCAVVLVDDRADADNKLLSPVHRSEWRCGVSHVRKGALLGDEFRSLANSWLCNRYGNTREWAYQGIPPRLLVEEMLQDLHGNLPPDYKFWCFEGHVGFIQVNLSRFGDHRRSLHLPDWEPLEVTVNQARPEKVPDPPKPLSEMITIAETLAAGIDFVRVDLYDLPDRIVFGELTNYPDAGDALMDNEQLLSELGARWRPEQLYGP